MIGLLLLLAAPSLPASSLQDPDPEFVVVELEGWPWRWIPGFFLPKSWANWLERPCNPGAGEPCYPAPAEVWDWPVTGPYQPAIDRTFGQLVWPQWPDTSVAQLHAGIDIPAPMGTQVAAGFAGVVLHADADSVILARSEQRCWGVRYRHIVSYVSASEPVSLGDALGQIKQDDIYGDHLHVELADLCDCAVTDCGLAPAGGNPLLYFEKGHDAVSPQFLPFPGSTEKAIFVNSKIPGSPSWPANDALVVGDQLGLLVRLADKYATAASGSGSNVVPLNVTVDIDLCLPFLVVKLFGKYVALQSSYLPVYSNKVSFSRRLPPAKSQAHWDIYSSCMSRLPMKIYLSTNEDFSLFATFEEDPKVSSLCNMPPTGSWSPEYAGKYRITLAAEDVDGNSATTSIDVVVKDP